MIFFLSLFTFYIGACLGSFLSVALWRTREKLPILFARSMCPLCREKIAWYDNIPLVSFFLLRAKCRACKSALSFRYPFFEALTGLLFAFTADYYAFENWPFILLSWAVVWTLLFVFFYDLLYKEIPDRVTLFPALLFFIFILLRTGGEGAIILDRLLGVALGSGFFLVQYLISKGKWIGGGDIRFGVFMGVLLGLRSTFLALLLAYVLGAIFASILLLSRKKEMGSEIAFGTFLSLATGILFFYGDSLWITLFPPHLF